MCERKEELERGVGKQKKRGNRVECGGSGVHDHRSEETAPMKETTPRNTRCMQPLRTPSNHSEPPPTHSSPTTPRNTRRTSATTPLHSTALQPLERSKSKTRTVGLLVTQQMNDREETKGNAYSAVGWVLVRRLGGGGRREGKEKGGGGGKGGGVRRKGRKMI